MKSERSKEELDQLRFLKSSAKNEFDGLKGKGSTANSPHGGSMPELVLSPHDGKMTSPLKEGEEVGREC